MYASYYSVRHQLLYTWFCIVVRSMVQRRPEICSVEVTKSSTVCDKHTNSFDVKRSRNPSCSTQTTTQFEYIISSSNVTTEQLHQCSSSTSLGSEPLMQATKVINTSWMPFDFLPPCIRKRISVNKWHITGQTPCSKPINSIKALMDFFLSTM